MGNFIHLRVHSDYSIYDSLLKAKEIPQIASEKKIPAVALTDASNLFGLIRFYRECLSLGIQPLIGADLNVMVDHGLKHQPFVS